ncbi:hypothetical protein [Prevotella veroralis]|uniref:hypothetical protein n=1 Tax=Prevotella veroralis TaxID=28137 RepID=UPI0012B508B2|nr:hypothetical protein [Prevotella veroralis]
MEEKKLKLFGEDVKLFGDDIKVIEEKFNFDYRVWKENYYNEKKTIVEESEKDKIYRILTKTPFEENAKDIYEYLCWIKTNKVSTSAELNKSWLEERKKELGVANALLIFFTNDKVSLKGQNYEKELNSELQDILKEATLKIYKELDLDCTELTYEEGKDILENEHSKFVENFKNDYWEALEFEDLSPEEKAGRWDASYTDCDMIYCFIEDLCVEREITKQQILSVISNLEEQIKEGTRKGRPKKNTQLLHAIKAFMQHHKYKPNNNMYRIIGECLCVMKFIDEDVIKGWEDKVNKKEAGQYFYPLVSYVKQMYLKVRAKAL